MVDVNREFFNMSELCSLWIHSESQSLRFKKFKISKALMKESFQD